MRDLHDTHGEILKEIQKNIKNKYIGAPLMGTNYVMADILPALGGMP